MSINLSPPLSCTSPFFLCCFLLGAFGASGALNCLFTSSNHVKMCVKKIMRLRCFQHITSILIAFAVLMLPLLYSSVLRGPVVSPVHPVAEVKVYPPIVPL